MSKVIVVKAGQTDWQAQGRLVGDTNLKLNEIGHRQAAAEATAISTMHPKMIHCGGDEPAKQTAEIIGSELRLKVKCSDALREMDLGVWEGLTVDAFKERFGRVFKQWRNDPLVVEPPEGESVSTVLARVKKGLNKLVKKNGDKSPFVVVLGGYAYAALLCDLRDHDFDRFWDYIESDKEDGAVDAIEIAVVAKETAGVSS